MTLCDACTCTRLTWACSWLMSLLGPAQVRAPMPPSYMFVIDVSVAAIACGMLTAVLDGIKSALDALMANERTMVGFLTFDTSLHFYNLKAGLAQPQMLVRCCLPCCCCCCTLTAAQGLSHMAASMGACLSWLPCIFCSSGWPWVGLRITQASACRQLRRSQSPLCPSRMTSWST